MPPRSKKAPRSPAHAALGKAIRQLREREGYTQEQLIDRGAASQFPRLGELERGVANPTFASLLKVAKALDIPLGDIITQWEQIMKEKT